MWWKLSNKVEGGWNMSKSTRLNRRAVLAAGAAGVAMSMRATAFAQQSDPLDGAALFADVTRYSNFGDHRTASDPDHRTSEWLADELNRAGFKTKLSPWTCQQFQLRAHRLAVDGEEIVSFPLWWPAPTGAEPILAPLAPAEAASLADKIGFVALGPVRGASVLPGDDVGLAVAAAARKRARGLIIATRSPAGEVVALNAMSGLTPWPIPVLLVGGREESRLAHAAGAGAPVSLLLDGQLDYAAAAYEVIGHLERGPQRVVISTPSSGWFRCAGERGPGVALWLGLARWAASRPGGPSLTFVASSGHELESLGIRHFVGHDAPPPERVQSWLHLGAGIATWDYEFGAAGARRLERASPARRLMTNEASYLPILTSRFADLAGLTPTLSSQPGGEMVLMASEGYRVWGFAGGSAFHHMPGDLPERITGPELLQPVARAIAGALSEIGALP
jgi:hypothetical protein